MVGKSTDAEALAAEIRFSFAGGAATAAAFAVGCRYG
jgi:predicted ATPase